MVPRFSISPEEWEQGKRYPIDSWPLFKDPSAITLILIAYMSFVLYLGPKFMKNRAPFNLKIVIVLYNALQVFYNFWILSWSAREPLTWKLLFNFFCIETTPDQELSLQKLMYTTYWHMTMNKILDLFDTVFFVLCKKQSHVTFLHVYHHASIAAGGWVVGKYFIGAELSVILGCNTVVHMVMYSYYLIAALGPAYKKYLWWKKYLTIIQIVQLVLIIAYMIASLWLSCGFNKGIPWLVIIGGSLTLALFVKFYFDAYGSNKLLSDKMAVCSSLQFSDSYTENETKKKI